MFETICKLLVRVLFVFAVLTVSPFIKEAYANGSPIVSVDYTPTSLRLPDYYVNNPVHIHTRLGIDLLDDPIFTDAENHFANMGAKVYTRWCKPADKGAWWPSSVGFVNPLTNGRDLAREMIDRAHENDLRILQYQWHVSDEYMAQQEPNWICLDENGATIQSARGIFLCINSPFRDYFTIRMLELLDRGADGFYYDSKHMPPQGCWCVYCQAKYKEQTGFDAIVQAFLDFFAQFGWMAVAVIIVIILAIVFLLGGGGGKDSSDQTAQLLQALMQKK